jgi:hypothetical protein
MTAVTTPAADLDDPLGLAPLEAALTWETTGPLPSWLDGTDLSESDDMSAVALPEPAPIAPPEREEPFEPESRVETLAVVGEKTEPRVDMAASELAASKLAASDLASSEAAANRSENRPSSSFNELLALVNIVSQCSSGEAIQNLPEPGLAPAPAPNPPEEIITPASEPAPFSSSLVLGSETCDASPSAPTANIRASAGPLPEPSLQAAETLIARRPPPRRKPALAELVEARDCLIVEAGGRCWAVPVHAVVCLKPWPASPADIDVDLAEELGDVRPRARHSRRWMLETTGATFGVDGLRGPGSIAWSVAEDDDSPSWILARADHRGEPVGLIDLERWHRVEVIPD